MGSTTTEAGIYVSVTGAERGECGVWNATLHVSGGERRVSGTATVVRRVADGTWMAAGDSVDCWLSRGVISLLDEYDARDRDAALDEIRALACAAASRAEDEGVGRYAVYADSARRHLIGTYATRDEARDAMGGDGVIVDRTEED